MLDGALLFAWITHLTNSAPGSRSKQAMLILQLQNCKFRRAEASTQSIPKLKLFMKPLMQFPSGRPERAWISV